MYNKKTLIKIASKLQLNNTNIMYELTNEEIEKLIKTRIIANVIYKIILKKLSVCNPPSKSTTHLE